MNIIRKWIIDFAIKQKDYDRWINYVGKNSETNIYIAQKFTRRYFDSIEYYNMLLKIKDTKELIEVIDILLSDCGTIVTDVLKKILNSDHFLRTLDKNVLGRITEKFINETVYPCCYALVELLDTTKYDWLYDYMCNYIKNVPSWCLSVITCINSYSSSKGNKKLVALASDLEDSIINKNDYDTLLGLATTIDNLEKFKKIESKILSSKDDNLIFDFVKKVGDKCNKQNFIDILSKSNDLTIVIKTAIYLDNSLLNNINSVEEFLLMISFLDIKDKEKNELLSDALKIVSLNSANKYKDDLNNKYISMLKNSKLLSKTLNN